jgi:site-specific recombinase XerD
MAFVMDEILTPAQATAMGFICPDEAKKRGLTKLDRTTLYRQAKAGKISSCLVEKGSRATYWVLASALGATATGSSGVVYEQLRKQWELEMKHGISGPKPLSKGYIELQKRYLKRYWDLLGEKPSIAGVSVRNFRTVLASIPDDEEKLQDHISKKLHIYRALTSFMQLLIREGLRTEDELKEFRKVKPKGKYKRQRHFLEEKDVRQLIAFNRSWINGRSQQNVELMELLIYLYAFVGCRLEEPTLLRTEYLMFDKGILKVLGKGSKERFVPMDPELEIRLREWMTKHRPASSSPWVIVDENGEQLSERCILKKFQRIEEAWLKKYPNGPAVHTHALRRAYAVIWATRGKPMVLIQSDLGHSDIRTTSLYIPVGIKQSQDFMRQYYKLQSPSSAQEEGSEDSPDKTEDLKKSAIKAMMGQAG